MSDGGVPYLELVLSVSVAITLLHLYLDVRQRKALKQPKPPAEVKALYTVKTFRAAQAYQLDKLAFGMARSAFDAAAGAALLLCGYYPATWQLAGWLLARVGCPEGEIWQSVAWVLLLSAAGTAMALPWGWWATFVLEARHGFNTTTPRTFFMDALKSLLLTAALAPPVVAAVTAILQRSGPLMPLYMWAFCVALTFLAMTVYPTLIAPIFNTYTPLEEGPLRASIEELAASLSFPLKKLFVVDGSSRSSHSNAYMYGFGANKRIVLYDTLLAQCSERQVVAVLAHELGHWKLRHTAQLLVCHQAVVGAQLALFAAARGAPGLHAAFGFAPGARPALAALVIFQMLSAPLDEALGLLANLASRAFEFQADAFAAALGRGRDLRAALVALSKENKGPPNVDAWYSTYHFSHPRLPERLAAIQAAAKKSS